MNNRTPNLLGAWLLFLPLTLLAIYGAICLMDEMERAWGRGVAYGVGLGWLAVVAGLVCWKGKNG